MALFRKGAVVCPSCRNLIRLERDSRAQSLPAECRCGERVRVDLDPEWWIGYRDPDGKYRRRKVGGQRRAAVRMLAQVQTSVVNGTYSDQRAAGAVRLAGLVEQYLISIKPTRKPANLLRERSCSKHLLRIFGASMRIDRIDTRRMVDYQRKRREEEAAWATITRELIVLSGALTYAKECKLIEGRPRIPRPRAERSRQVFLTRDQARDVLDVSPPYLRRLVLGALATGMRRGELLAMRWSWVDLLQRQIWIPGEATKSGRGRAVPINNELMVDLSGHLSKSGISARVYRAPAVWQIRRDFLAALDLVGLGELGVRFHDLRHTAASWMVQAGVDLYRVAEILGHRSIKTTQRYAHLRPRHLAEAICHTEVGTGETAEIIHLPRSK